MATIADRVFDNGLVVLDTEANRLDICSTEPTTYTEATATYTLGNKTGITIAAPSDRTGGGRKVTVSAITDGSVTATGNAAFYALVDTTNSRLLVTGAISNPQTVTSGNPFTLAAFDIGFPDPT